MGGVPSHRSRPCAKGPDSVRSHRLFADSSFPTGALRRALGVLVLLALILGTGKSGEDVGSLAARIARDADGLWGLGRMSVAELARMPGIGPVKAARLAAMLEAGSRALLAP